MINYKDLSDHELIDLLKSDDHQAFNHLFKRNQALSFSFTYKRINDKESAKDLVHEVFADLWENRLSLNIPGNFQAYLYTVLRNRIINQYRRKKIVQKYIDHATEHSSQAHTGTDHLVRNKNLSALIEKEVAALPDKMRLVFELSRTNLFSRKQIASHLNLPEETIKSRMRRALIILKNRLGTDALITA
ncbi:RNA polymerase sigma factor [Pedobacter sp. L105]|uniref:RNA polymerase sigma factor n=1 Tax=Pedobacter sp. L105 TaxID=1641871 RepID=UPI00131BEC9A|nr:RNA polymerase sigma-70 factor [Pedobacter sp. L105]